MSGAGIWTSASRSFGPYVYVERGGFMLHAWARWFGLPWYHGFGARVCIRCRGRYFSKGWGIS